MTECFIKNNDVSRTCNICRKEHFSKEIHLWSISIFTVRQVTSALKKKNHNKTSPHKYVSGSLLLQHQHETIPRVRLYSTRRVPSHTHPLTQTLLPLHACTQTLHSHVKLLTHNQSSKLWHSLTQTQTCFIPSPASENHVNHLSLFNLPTQAKQICPISTPDTPVSLSSNTLSTNRPLFLLLPT